MVLLPVSTIWGACAIGFGDSNGGNIELAVAGLFSMLGLLALIGLMLRRWQKILISSYLLVFAFVLIGWLNIRPSNDRHWQTDARMLAYADFAGDLVTA